MKDMKLAIKMGLGFGLILLTILATTILNIVFLNRIEQKNKASTKSTSRQ